ncbi:MAG TPA: Do family serine endopeptidase [Melioribacteraceae bacterium]|nr:Do family serine endopeptidase [Melioribacteraceae bacterium]
MNKKSLIGTLTLLFAGFVFGAVLVSGFGWVKPGYADVKLGLDEPPIKNIDATALAFNNAFIEVADKVTPSIVQIEVVSRSKEQEIPEQFKFFFPFNPDTPREQMGGGSGVIISDDGYILTNNHVVENAINIEVQLHDKRKYSAKIIGNDPLTDLAVIQIETSGLSEAYLGDSDKLKVGQWVMAIGNPLSLSSTVTAGIVSAVGRSLNLIKESYGVENFIQTDAAINPGNSGGALVDLSGSVVGINTAIATNGVTGSYIGYGFAIPINIAKAVASDLIANGKVSRGYIGVNISEVDAATADAVGLDKPKGIMIQGIVKDGAAAKEDIKIGDIIIKVNGVEVNKPNELQAYIAKKRAGDEVKLTLYRDGKEIERYIELKAPDKDKSIDPVNARKRDTGENSKPGKEIKLDDIGLTVANPTDKELDDFGANNGVKVTEVKRFSKAFNQNIFKNTLILEVDRKPVNNIKEFEELINKKKGKSVLLTIALDKENNRIVGLEIPN